MLCFNALTLLKKIKLQQPDQKLPLEAFLWVPPVSVFVKEHGFILLKILGLSEEQSVIHSLTKGSNCSSYPVLNDILCLQAFSRTIT